MYVVSWYHGVRPVDRNWRHDEARTGSCDATCYPATIPSSVFGSFLEPIGHATYGGLWSDVIENPSFEEGLWSVSNIEALLRERPNLRRASSLGLPLPWEPLTDQGARYLPVMGDAAIQAAGSKTFVEGVLPQTETVSSKWGELLVMHNEPDESGSKCENAVAADAWTWYSRRSQRQTNSAVTEIRFQ